MNLIMFDIDGTLVQSSDFDEEIYLKTAYEVLGREISSNWDQYSHGTDSGILYEALDRYKISGDKEPIHDKFKATFLNHIFEYIEENSNDISEVKGASEFIKYLRGRNDIKIAIATGAWEESGKLKLEAAGIDINGLPFASSSDHYDRTEIMKLAEARVVGKTDFLSKIYFGDAPWDKKACEILNYRFVAVGNRVKNEIQIPDYQQKEKIMEMLNL
ncbi:HAD family hydrolase [Thermodesulfobacteriota bacterium]